MNFYKIIPTIAIILLIICLTAVGVALNYTSDNVIFPPSVSDCPDYFVKNDNNTCVNKKNLGGDAVKCNMEDFNKEEYLNPGTGPSSGICAKKKWAIECNVDWDGITNNGFICNREMN